MPSPEIAVAAVGVFLVFLILLLVSRKRITSLKLQLEAKALELSSKIEEIGKLQGRAADLQKLIEDLSHQLEQIRALNTKLSQENDRLAKYSNIADADERATQLLAEAKQTLERTVHEATETKARILAEAQEAREAAENESNELRKLTRQETKGIKDQAKAALDAANEKVAEIIRKANERAEEIAGSAFEAMKKADELKQTARAMKNIIEGYGDQYIIPSHSLLDDLAEEFGFKEAGRELKAAREHAKSMLRSNTAATCDYKEVTRKMTAVEFVVDAFNGKVDSILTRVKHDNAGTLEQKIRDAFNLVNHLGKPFKDARIKEAYLEARLSELKWAAIVQQIKLEEREEQRRIREQMREEQKARREYEKAIREAAKEEDMLRKAMEKAQKMIDKASAEQKAQYEEQLRGFQEKLKEAEERNQRAVSMAQLTRRGHVYIISNVGSFGEEVFKIGLTRRLEPLDRVKELGDSSVPFAFDVHAMILHDDAPALETKLHKKFVLNQMNKVNHRKEFFRVSLKELREEIESMGLDAKWTMAAEAREYRETQAIENAIQNDHAAMEAWINRQLDLDVADLSSAFDDDEGPSA